ncbi:NAD(P)-dependent alcohol dehydrogenase [Kribbella alba]
MKAMIQTTYGEAEVLRFADIDRPVAGDDEVLLRVKAAGVDIGTWHLMAGKPYLLRLGFGLRGPKIPTRGREVAGRVEVAGKNVTEFKPGDEVFGICDGSFAEYAVARPSKLALKPANLTFNQAAVVPISGTTALQGLQRLQEGQRALIIGAAGGVGTFAVQLAKSFGAHVTGVCSTTKLALVRSLGADEVVDYTREDLGDGRYDFILDTAGNRSLKVLRRSLAQEGTLVIVGGEGGGSLHGGLDRVLRAALLTPFVSQKLLGLLVKENAADLDRLRTIIENGELTPVVGRTFQLAEAADAVRLLRHGHPGGKVVVTV